MTYAPHPLSAVSQVMSDDHRLDVAARQAGHDLEAAMLLGDKQAARQAMHRMNAATRARIAAREPCYFVEQGDSDRLAMRWSS